MKLLLQIFLILFLPFVASAAPLAVTFTSSTGPGPTIAIYVHNGTASTAYLAITGHATGTWPGGYTIPNNASISVNWATLAPGATYTAYNAYTFGGGVNCSSFSSSGVVGADSASGGAIVQSYSFAGSGGGILTFDIGAAPPCITNLTWTVTDHSQYGSAYGIVDIYTPPTGGYRQYYSGTFVRPGLSSQLVLNNVPCADVNKYAIAVIGSDTYQTSSGGTNQTWVNGNDWTGTTNAAPFSFTADQSPSGSEYNPATTNANILWTAAAGTNAAVAAQQGSSALYDALTKSSAAAHADAAAILNSVSNSATETTLRGISNLLSNGIGITNGFGSSTNGSLVISNVATETTLSGLSNLLALAENTNHDGTAEAAFKVQGQTYASTGSNELYREYSLPSSSEALGDPIGDEWQISVPYLTGYTIDLNPFHQNWVIDLAAFMKSCITWISAIGLFYNNITVLLGAVKSSGSWKQAEFTGFAVAGTQVNALAAYGVAVAITVIMLALPAIGYALAGWDVSLSSVFTVPFHAAAPHLVAIGLYMTDQFLPVMFMVYCALCGLLYRMKVNAVVFAAQTLVRFCVS